MIHEVPSLQILYYLKASPLGFVGCFCSGLIISAIYAFLPDFATDAKLSPSLIMFLTILGGFILQWPIGIISDKYERRKVLMYVSVLVIVPTLCALFFVSIPWLTYTFCFMMGGLSFVIYPISIAKVCDSISSEEILSATSVLLLVYGAGSAIGPIFVSGFIYLFSSLALFLCICVISLVIFAYGLYTMLKTPIEAEEHTEFVPLPNITPVANELDPRCIMCDEEEVLAGEPYPHEPQDTYAEDMQ